MLQIKTIHDTDPATFDKAVNAALVEGWSLTRRLTGPGPDFVAELEHEIIDEAERRCGSCAYYDLSPILPPCSECSADANKWEPAT